MSANFISHLAEVSQRLDAASKKGVAAGAAKLHELTIKNLKQQGHGITYRMPGTKRKTYVASAPGEYPATRTGRLSGAGGVLLTLQEEGAAWVGFVHSPLKYAVPLERKDSPKGRRPFLSRTYEESRDTIQAAVNTAIATEMNK